MGRATAIRTVRRVTNALVNMAAQVIRWPDENKIEDIVSKFKVSSGFHNVIGAIDGTHIRIAAPKQDAQGYIIEKVFIQSIYRYCLFCYKIHRSF